MTTLGVPQKKVFFPNLDGLRFIAFLFVFLQHGFYNWFRFFEAPSGFLKNLGLFFFFNGEVGVSIFFVLSGFLITYLLMTEITAQGGVNVPYFYIRRALRIWPLYYVVITFALLTYPFVKSKLGIISPLSSEPLYYFTFLSNFDVIHIQHVSPGNAALSSGITWSVAVEEQFYLVWPLLLCFWPSRYRRWMFLLLILISSLFRFCHAYDSPTLYFHTLSVLSDLAMGGLAAYEVFYSVRFREWIKNLTPKTVSIFYIFGIIGLIFSLTFQPSPWNAMLTRITSAVFFAFVILEQNFGSVRKFRLSQSRFMTFWGKYTYGLYLLHPVAITLLQSFAKVVRIDFESEWNSFFLGILSLVLSFFMAYVSFKYLEAPFLRLKRHFE